MWCLTTSQVRSTQQQNFSRFINLNRRETRFPFIVDENGRYEHDFGAEDRVQVHGDSFKLGEVQNM